MGRVNCYIASLEEKECIQRPIKKLRIGLTYLETDHPPFKKYAEMYWGRGFVGEVSIGIEVNWGDCENNNMSYLI